jgi:hypothetical protein
MAFSFEKFVQKSTRGLFLFIVICMVVPLVLWGYMGKSGAEREEDKGEAGTLYNGLIHVSKLDYNRHVQTAPASYWWKKFNDPMTMMMMRYGQKPKDPTPDQLSEQAWEDIILLKEAKANGIEVSEQESLMEMRDIYQKFVGRPDYSDEIMNRIARELFHVELSTFQTWISDHVVIDKLLNLISNSEFADYDKVYDQLLNGHQMAKVWYAGFDPKEVQKDLRAPSNDEIIAQYQKNKDKWKIPAKVQVAYLMVDAEELKKKEPEPSADAVKAYYEAHKPEFAKPHEHHPGEEHKDDEKTEYRSFDEVKGEIPDKIKMQAAERKAAEIMSKVDVALGAAATANGGKYPDDVFDQLYKKFKDEGVTYDITLKFDPKQVEDIEKVVGANSTLSTWAFDPQLKLGDVSNKIKTGKGTVLFRLSAKVDSKESGISDHVREAIVKDLQKDQIKKKTQQVANNVVQEITTHGMNAARKKYPLDWHVTRYFKLDGETGIEDAALGQGIAQQIRGKQVLPGKAAVLSGAMLRSRDKTDWAYAVYLEDLADVPPDDVNSQFSGSRKNLDEEARKRYRDTYIQATVKEAAVKPDESLKKPSGKSTDSAPPQ